MDIRTNEIINSPKIFAQRAHVSSMEIYRSWYQDSVSDPESFWATVAQRITWESPFSRAKTLFFDFTKAQIAWFADGRLNASVNCLDRHVRVGNGYRTAIIWEGDDPKDQRRVTYGELLKLVCRFSHVLAKHGVRKGDRVCIYLPMIPEAAVAMLACARIGAIHSVVFGGFSAESLRNRIVDSTCKILITADEGMRGGRPVALKETSDEALAGVDCIEKMIVVRRTGTAVDMVPGRDLWWHDEMAGPGISDDFPPVSMNAEDPLFILYTSGSTGKPKGVLHTTGGYLVYASYTHQMVFDVRPDDIYWCTADVGWITGHSYVLYGPLANGTTTLMFEGVPNHPDYGRFWDVVDRHGVTIFYTAPTAIRALMRMGDEPVKKHARQSLRLLGTVGEPINPEVWKWYHRVVGDGRCPVVDTWWQTETGGILISPLPGATPQKPGSATLPFFGVRPEIVDEHGHVLEGNDVRGNLCLSFPWPGMMRTVYGDHQRFIDTYFSRFPGKYFTGDGSYRDKDGYYWITGRVDDVINVAGHRLGTAEIESALVSHPAVSEAAVVGYPHDIKGQGIYAYVTLKASAHADEKLRHELIHTVRKVISPIATPDKIQFAPGLPKTRSGKIMRRILRKIAEGNIEELGDTSTLADPGVVQNLVMGRL